MIEFIRDWIIQNNLDVKWNDEKSFVLDGKDYLCIESKEGKIVDEEFNLILNREEQDAILIHRHCFVFGDKVYWSELDSSPAQLNVLKYLGKAAELGGFPYLGIHGGYELCSGSRSYGDWCKKANFLSIQALGLAERHTLAGALKFQGACLKNKIKPIIGETITVKSETEEYKVKLYVSNAIGWQSLLKIHKNLNVDNASAYANEDVVVSNAEGLYCVIQADTMLNDEIVHRQLNAGFKKVYFQFDPVQYKSEKRDLYCLNCLKHYIDNYIDMMSMCLICDSYYLDKEDYRVRKILAFVGKGGFTYESENQHLKALEEVAQETIELFTTAGEEFAFAVLERAMDGLNEIVSGCDFIIPTGQIHLPKYEMSEEESAQFETNEDLFWHVIEEGLEKVKEQGKDVEKYIERVQIEYEVIALGGFQDYFLTVRDINNWCEYNGIYVGPGRGSIGGSIIAYFMNITKVDALEYGLIFERFLNVARVSKKVKKEVIVINGDIEKDIDSIFSIFRNGKNIRVSGNELQEGDQIVNIE